MGQASAGEHGVNIPNCGCGGFSAASCGHVCDHSSRGALAKHPWEDKSDANSHGDALDGGIKLQDDDKVYAAGQRAGLVPQKEPPQVELSPREKEPEGDTRFTSEADRSGASARSPARPPPPQKPTDKLPVVKVSPMRTVSRACREILLSGTPMERCGCCSSCCLTFILFILGILFLAGVMDSETDEDGNDDLVIVGIVLICIGVAIPLCCLLAKCFFHYKVPQETARCCRECRWWLGCC
mmetsp:Transcript_561/g.1288  ORF Transcript_561/g.1288 Transcript_561/m.1288 type:complete len:240 (+) Transcript_561:92-811(+)